MIEEIQNVMQLTDEFEIAKELLAMRERHIENNQDIQTKEMADQNMDELIREEERAKELKRKMEEMQRKNRSRKTEQRRLEMEEKKRQCDHDQREREMEEKEKQADQRRMIGGKLLIGMLMTKALNETGRHFTNIESPKNTKSLESPKSMKSIESDSESNLSSKNSKSESTPIGSALKMEIGIPKMSQKINNVPLICKIINI